MSNKHQANLNLKQKRLADGLCPMCTTRPLAPGRKACRRCLDLANDRRKAKYAQKNSTICMSCLTKPKHNTHTLCLDCLKYRANYRLSLKLETFAAYGGNKCSCAHCQLSNGSDYRFLTIDHINNDGNIQQKRGINLYSWLKKHGYPDGYRILCYNCNSGRQLNNGVCPHQQESDNITRSKSAVRRLKLRLEALHRYGECRCACSTCPEHNAPHTKFLTIDHINNDGAIHRKELAGKGVYSSLKLLNWLKRNNWPPGYQVLCFNCNIARSHNNGVCPHEDGNNTEDNLYAKCRYPAGFPLGLV
jgi:hypothetical protein